MEQDRNCAEVATAGDFVHRAMRQILKAWHRPRRNRLPDGILGSPGLGYVREWILRNTRVLASIDLHPDTFQPFVSIQTSVLVLQRKTAELIGIEEAARRINDYSVFMAIGSHVGHDKRGTVTYVRDRKGNEIVEEIEEQIKEWESGTPVYRKQTTRRKVVDDNTLQIAQEFRKWLSEQG